MPENISVDADDAWGEEAQRRGEEFFFGVGDDPTSLKFLVLTFIDMLSKLY